MNNTCTCLNRSVITRRHNEVSSVLLILNVSHNVLVSWYCIKDLSFPEVPNLKYHKINYFHKFKDTKKYSDLTLQVLSSLPVII